MTLPETISSDALLIRAFEHRQNGRAKDAEKLCREVLARDPDSRKAHQLMGLLCEERGAVEEAAEHFRSVAADAPADARLRVHLAGLYGGMGRLEEAEAELRGVLDLVPGDVAAWSTLGAVLDSRGRLEEAVSAYDNALAQGAGDARLRNNYGITLARLGRVEDAEAQYRAALEIEPTYVDALSNLGNLLGRRGRFTDALELLRRALDLSPNSVELMINLGEVMTELGEFRMAQDLYARALSLRPDLHAARMGLIAALAQGRIARYQPAFDRLLGTALSWRDVRLDDLAPLIARHLILKHDLPARLDATTRFEVDAEVVARLAADPLVPAFLTGVANAHPVLEAILTRLRAALLVADDAEWQASGPVFSLAIALARQCAHNEYVFATTESERQLVAGLHRRLETVGDWAAPADWVDFVRYAMYDRPARLPRARRLADLTTAPDTLRELAREEIVAAETERRIAAALPSLTEIRDEVSLAVSRQYEDNPYPRWLSLNRREQERPAAILRNLFPHYQPPDFLAGPVRILVAGCGTGQHPIAEVALTYLDGDILAIDLSRSSLAYAARRADEIGVDGLRFAQADILELGDMPDRFELIEAGGVLHHLADPMAGWRILRRLLVPDGVMLVALYSRRSRRHIIEARERFADLRIEPTPAAIRDFRRLVMTDDRYGDFRGLLDSPDFYGLSACRDLVFHVQEHQFDLLEVAAMIDDLDLELIGLQHPGPGPIRMYRSTFPEDPAMTDLRNWDELEVANPKMFAGMYHLWCRTRS